MAGPRKGETAANFLRRLNQESYPYIQAPQGDIEDMDQYDRDAARYQALDYLKSAAASGGNFERTQPQLNMDMRGLSRAVGQPLPPPLEPETRLMENKRRLNNNIALTYIGQNPAAAMPKGYRADARMEPYRVNNYFTNDMSLADTENAAGYNQDRDYARDKIATSGAPRRPESFDREDLERNDRMHDKAMRGGDDTLSYTETGDIVIPNKVAQANPGLTMAAMKALADMGANPRQYIAGSDEGSYNPSTGAQEFGWWEDLLKMGVKGADYIGNSKFGQAALTGLGTAAASKYLMGQDTKTALYTGAGSALGYGVGDYLENRANVKASELKPTDDKYREMPEKTTLTNYDTADGTLKNLGSAAMDAFDNFSGKGLQYALYGAGAGQMMAPVQNNFAPLNLKDPTPTYLPPIKKMAAFEENERANLSATIPPPAPIAPIMPTVMPQGVTYQQRVRDKDTGEYRYVGASNPSDQSAFARAVKGASRRRGLGFGNAILV